MKKKSVFCLGLIILVLTICPFLKSGVHLYDGYQNEGDNFISIASLNEEIGYEWNRTWGTTHPDVCYDIAIDSSDYIYLAGRAMLDPAFQAALVKYDTSGNLIWASSWDGVHDVRAHAVAVDSSDNIYMGGHGTLGLGGFDLFVVKYNSAGTEQWSRIWGGSDFERIYGLAVDSSDNVYLVGETSSWGSGYEDMVIVKYSSAGTLLWNRTWGESGTDIAYAVGCDNSNNVYMVGDTTSFTGEHEWNIVKYDSTGALLWNRTWGYVPSNDYAYAISFDSSDNVFVAGEMWHPVTHYASVGLVKFDSSGVELYNRTWNEIGFWGNQEVRARDIVLDSSENIYLACYTAQWNHIGTQSYMGLLKYNTSGDAQGFVRWDKDNTAAYGIALDSNENIYIGGESDEDFCLVKYNLVPEIVINLPNENEFFGSDAPNFDISITDSDLDSRWYTIDEGLTNITFTGLTGTISQVEWDKLSDGPVNLTFYTNDTASNIASADVIINKDASDPQIVINSPLNYEVFGSIAPNFDISIVEPNLESTWYTMDGGLTNITFIGLTGTIDQAEWDKLLNGSVNLTFYANDSVGNIGSAEVLIYKDINIPQITINAPLANEFFGSTAPNFNISIIESNLHSRWYTLDGGLTNITFIGLTGTINQTEWNKFGEGAITITFYANDTTGNIGHADVTIYKDSIDPQIVINAPLHEENFGSIAPNFDIAITELNLDSTWYNIEGGLNITFSGLTGTIDQTEWEKIGDGGFYITFYANDSAGNIGLRWVLIVKDTSIPQITIYTPLENEFFGVNAPDFNIYIEESNLNSTWYTIDDGITNITFSESIGTIDQTEWEKKSSSGSVTIRFYANDTLGLLGFEQVIIYKDIDVSSSQLAFIPHSGTNVVNTSTIFTLTAEDGLGSGVSVIRYKINDSAWIDYTGGFDLTGYAYGYYIISYYAIDEVGNIESVNSIIVELVEIPSEQAPPMPIELIILISVISGGAVIGVATLLLIRRKRGRIE